jgi:hypothetical protein
MGISAEMMRQEIGFWREQAAASAQAAAAAASVQAYVAAASASAAGASAIPPDADDLALRLRAINISDDAAVLDAMSAKLRRAGIFALEDLQGLSLDELKEAVALLSLNAMQLRRLFKAVAAVDDGGSEGHKTGGKN